MRRRKVLWIDVVAHNACPCCLQDSGSSAGGAVSWDMLADITAAGRAELQGAGLTAGTAAKLVQLGYTEAGDLEHIDAATQQTLLSELPAIQASKLRKLLSVHTPSTVPTM